MDKANKYLEYLSKTGGKVGYDIVVDGEKISYSEVIAELKAKDERIEKEVGRVVDLIEQHEQDVSTIKLLQMTIGDYKEIVKAKDKEILAFIHRVADITKENIEANNRIAELEAKLKENEERKTKINTHKTNQ